MDEKILTVRSNKNKDLNIEPESNHKQDFLTVGRDSNVRPSIDTKEIFNESESSFYPIMSKQSQKIVEYYKAQSEKDSRKCLDESYESSNSKSDHGAKMDQNSLENSIDYNPVGCGPYETVHTESNNMHNVLQEQLLSPGRYSTGNILEHIDNHSPRKVQHTYNGSMQIQNSLQNQITAIEEKSTSFKDMMRQYIEK